MNTPLTSATDAALDPFLMQSFGVVEENGMDLSVLSAFARSGLDPWTEAGRLAGLPKQAAAAAIGRHLGLEDGSPIAARLAALLPDPASPFGNGLKRLPGTRQGVSWRWLLLSLAAGALMIAVAASFSGQPSDAGPVISAGRRAEVARGDHARYRPVSGLAPSASSGMRVRKFRVSSNGPPA